MATLITVLHIMACIFLVLVVLLQQGKGADMGAVFGGSSSTIFGSSGAGNFLTRLTTGMAALFMITSLTLTYFSAQRVTSTVFDTAPLTSPPPLEEPFAGEPEPGAPADPAAAAPAGAPEPQAAAEPLLPAAQLPAPPAAAPLPAENVPPAQPAAGSEMPAPQEAPAGQ